MGVLATALGVLAHFLHPGIAPWSSTVEAPILAVCFLALGARTALASGVVTRAGWWLSRWTGVGLIAVAIAAAFALILLAVGEFTRLFLAIGG